MPLMKKALLALLCSLSIAGCSSAAQESANVEEQNSTAASQKTAAKVIVVFKEGMTYDEAAEAAAAHGMKVSHYYKSLSERSNKPYMALESSSQSAEEMVRSLKNDPRVDSVSIDYERSIQSGN